ncbi:hypothetical protein BCF74_12063 [Knoellia remsis]|uniref:Uncharacterized protein n=2 Tax=Knoellia remsis TaxID=407159 RepID=A0A2T0UDW4_9MICO|nr:hypothetical protein BCF74_12063 [Knoellia remsis]
MDNSAAGSAIFARLGGMTSKRSYAVLSTLVAAALPLGACSSSPAPAGGEERPKASAPAYTPAYDVTPEQLRAVVAAGRRFPDNITGTRINTGAKTMGLCDTYSGADGRSWFSDAAIPAPQEGTSSGLGGDDSTRIGRAYTGAALLDDSPSAARVMDERIARWSTCTDGNGTAYTTQKVDIPGAAASLVRTATVEGAPPWSAQVAIGVARVEGVLFDCTTGARTVKLAQDTTTSCLREMVAALPFAAGQQPPVTDANRTAATKVMLASVANAETETTFRTDAPASRPCDTSKATFLPKGSVAALYSPRWNDAGTEQLPGGQFGMIRAELLADPAAAQAKVAAARKTFGGCSGSWNQGQSPTVMRGTVTGVTDETFGDGGFTITATTKFDPPPAGSNVTVPSKPGTWRTSVLSVGALVLETEDFDTKAVTDISSRLAKVAPR